MAAYNLMFPIQPGKDDEARAFAADVAGPRRDEFAAHHNRVGNTRETWALATTPMGSFILVWFEGEDAGKAFADLAANQSEYHQWFRERVLTLTGTDLSAPPAGPLPETLVDWTA